MTSFIVRKYRYSFQKKTTKSNQFKSRLKTKTSLNLNSAQINCNVCSKICSYISECEVSISSSSFDGKLHKFDTYIQNEKKRNLHSPSSFYKVLYWGIYKIY